MDEPRTAGYGPSSVRLASLDPVQQPPPQPAAPRTAPLTSGRTDVAGEPAARRRAAPDVRRGPAQRQAASHRVGLPRRRPRGRDDPGALHRRRGAGLGAADGGPGARHPDPAGHHATRRSPAAPASCPSATWTGRRARTRCAGCRRCAPAGLPARRPTARSGCPGGCSTCPRWVQDYVLVHELAHLLEARSRPAVLAPRRALPAHRACPRLPRRRQRGGEPAHRRRPGRRPRLRDPTRDDASSDDGLRLPADERRAVRRSGRRSSLPDRRRCRPRPEPVRRCPTPRPLVGVGDCVGAEQPAQVVRGDEVLGREHLVAEVQRVVEVVGGRQQVRVRPDRVPPADAALLGDAPPQRRGIAQPARPQARARRAWRRSARPGRPRPGGGGSPRAAPPRRACARRRRR